jgi:hypothetical protein
VHVRKEIPEYPPLANKQPRNAAMFFSDLGGAIVQQYQESIIFESSYKKCQTKVEFNRQFLKLTALIEKEL